MSDQKPLVSTITRVKEKSLQHWTHSWGWTWVLHQEVLCSVRPKAWEDWHKSSTADYKPCSGWEVSSPSICRNNRGYSMSCHSFVICHQSCVSMALDQNKMAFMDFLHPSVWLLVNRALLSCLHFCFGIYFLRKQRQQCSFLKGTLEHFRHPGTESLPNYINSYRCPLGFG